MVSLDEFVQINPVYGYNRREKKRKSKRNVSRGIIKIIMDG